MKTKTCTNAVKRAFVLALLSVSLVDVAYAADETIVPSLPATILGVFNPESPEQAQELGAKAVRFIITSRMLEKRNMLETINKLQNYKRHGLIVIASVSFYGDREKKRPLPEPGSAQWEEMLHTFEVFVRAAGPSVDYLAIGNEPTLKMAASDFEPGRNGKRPVIQFFTALANRAQMMAHSDTALSHLKISSPALVNLNRIGKGRNAGHLALPLLEWAMNDPDVHVIDIHAHVRSVSELEESLEFVRQRTSKPVIITEWSQAGAVNSWPRNGTVPGWLDKNLDPRFAAKWKVEARQTNRDFIRECYNKPVEKVEWDELVATAPYDPSFMKDAFAAMVRYGVVVATYGAQKQYGDPEFDSKQLLANLTVVPGPGDKSQENFLFAKWFRELVKSH